jgi:SAM-dependent methyltransferase
MGRSDKEFLQGGDALIAQISRDLTIDRKADIVDIGSGYGRLAHALWRSGHRGRYFGFDILADQVEWCRRHLTPATRGRYRFQHLDAANDRYNPAGAIPATQVEIASPFVADLALLTSVFTHMYAEEIEHYVDQLRPTVRPTGALFATIFLMNQSQQRAHASGSGSYALRHQVGPESWSWSATDPLHVIAHDETWFTELLETAGFTVVAARYGSWCGRPDGLDFQDSIVARPR